MLPEPAQIFSIAISGSAAAVSLGCLLLSRARSRPAWMAWMAAFAALLSVMAFGQLLRNTCDDPNSAVVALRILSVSSLAIGIASLGLFRALCGLSAQPIDQLLTAALVVMMPITLVIPGALHFHAIDAVTHQSYGWWGTVSVMHGLVSPMLVVLRGLFLLVVLRMGWMTVTSRTRLDRISCTLMFVVMATILVPIVHGLGLIMGWWGGIPLGEYGLSVMFLVLCAELYRRERELEHQEGERRSWLEAILGHGQGFAGLLEANGRVVLANQVALNAVGVDSAAVIGRHFADTPWWTHSTTAQGLLRDAVARAAQGATARFLTTHRLHDGREIDVDFSLTPFRQQDGQVRLLIAEGRDVTELRRYERLMREGSRLEAIGQLASGIAHDFNNILGGIMGSAELALMQTQDPNMIKRLEIILSGAGRAGDLTKRLLSYARKAKTADVEVRVNTLVAETLEFFQRVAGADISIERDLTAFPDTIRGDPAELQSALLNLCVNGRDAMPQGGALRLVTDRIESTAGMVDCSGQPIAPGPYVRIAVSDAGTGIPADVLPHIFKPFFTTKPEGQGTGLGLSQVYGFVSQSGGVMILDSKVGAGTAVQIYLPRWVGEPNLTARHTDPRLLESSASRVATVLLVEDETDIRRLTAEMLRDRQHVVIEASDGSSALSALQQRLTVGESIDILVADIGLPGGTNGRQLAYAVRQHLPAVPVLMITGYAGQALGPTTEVAEGIALLSKPFSFEILAARVESLVAAASTIAGDSPQRDGPAHQESSSSVAR